MRTIFAMLTGLVLFFVVAAASAVNARIMGPAYVAGMETRIDDGFYPWQQDVPTPRAAREAHHGPRLADLTPVLRGKVGSILDACPGARLISGYRPGARVAGSGHPSLHSLYPSRAADLSGNPSCIYGHLHGWDGGYSTDYGRVRHVHVSYSPPGEGYLGGREWHARFAHYTGHRIARLVHHIRRLAGHGYRVSAR